MIFTVVRIVLDGVEVSLDVCQINWCVLILIRIRVLICIFIIILISISVIVLSLSSSVELQVHKLQILLRARS